MAKITISERQARIYIGALSFTADRTSDGDQALECQEELNRLRDKMSKLERKLGPKDQRRPST